MNSILLALSNSDRSKAPPSNTVVESHFYTPQSLTVGISLAHVLLDVHSVQEDRAIRT